MAKFEVSILNAKEEEVVNKLSDAIKEFGFPKLADTIDEQTLVARSVDEFVAYWEGLFPEIGGAFQVDKKHTVDHMWGSLYPLNGFRMGIVSIFVKNPRGVPEKAQQAIDAFYDLLVDEASEVATGTQKFVEERYERFQR